MSRARDLAIAGALMCGLAALFALPALYVPGFAALLLAVIAPVWVVLAAAGAQVTLRAPATTIHEGERLRVTVSVRRGPLPFPAATLTPWPGGQAVSVAARQRRSELAVYAVAPRRGRQTLGPARLRIADPLGICVRELRSSEHQLLVLPRVYPIHALALRQVEQAGRAQPHGALELDSLRAYAPGGPAARIHWPTVARTGVLMERSFTGEADPRVLVMLDAHDPESEEALDQALRAAASLCVHLSRRGGCLLMLPDDRRAAVLAPDPRCWPALHARLALIEPGASLPRVLPALHPRTVLYVTACTSDAPAVRGECYRVGPRPLPGLAAAFTVAGCTGQIVSGASRARTA
ncbi:MAG TPA: DUF58 domain-containing protein [Solirubrobacteraceae bacterium]|nr:DUF58 domain-containing protein [Solirubrobacteraceae bacterium]